MPSASIVAIVGLSVAIIGVGVRLIAAFKPPKSERAKNALGNTGYGISGIGLIVIVALCWHLYVPLTFQLPVRWSVVAPLPTPRVQANSANSATPANGNIAQGSNRIASAPLSRTIHVFQMTVDFRRLTMDGNLDFGVMAFNGSQRPILLSRTVDGVISWRTGEASPYVSFADQPQIDSHSPLSAASYAEFQFSLRQHLSPGIADEISKAFSGGKPIGFMFADLKISAKIKEPDSQEEKLSLWHGVICRRGTTTDTFYSRVVSLGAPITQKGGSVTAQRRKNENSN